MKRISILPVMLLIMFSCSKEQNNQPRELDISLKSVIVGDDTENFKVIFYPNPFQERVSINISGTDSTTILISNNNRDMKKFSLIGSRVTLDFSKEKSGVYYCEVLSKKTVLRTYLIKN